jgi:hypothetical protein
MTKSTWINEYRTRINEYQMRMALQATPRTAVVGGVAAVVIAVVLTCLVRRRRG